MKPLPHRGSILPDQEPVNDSGLRMSTRHQGARVQDYAALSKGNSSMSPVGVKRQKISEHGDFKSRHKHSSTGKSKPSGLGFADSDEEKNVHEFNENVEEQDEEGEQEIDEEVGSQAEAAEEGEVEIDEPDRMSGEYYENQVEAQSEEGEEERSQSLRQEREISDEENPEGQRQS
jgi:hypothetical protein